MARSVCLLGSYCVRVTEITPANNLLGGDGQTQRGTQVGKGIIGIPHGVRVLGRNFARSLLSGVANVWSFVQALPVSRGTLLSPRQARTAGHPRGTRAAMEWRIRHLHAVKRPRPSTQPGNTP